MKKNILIQCILIAVLLICFLNRIISSNEANKELKEWNSTVHTQLSSLNLKSILRYKRELFYNESFPVKSEKNNQIPLEYDMANYDIDLMPMIVSDKIILYQTHSIKIFGESTVYEYQCKEQIRSITYPKVSDSTIIFFTIKFDSDIAQYRVPVSERKWFLQKIVFSDGKFIEGEITYIDFPDIYTLNDFYYSEISFFIYTENYLYIILTDQNQKSAIFQFTEKGKMIKKVFDGCILIPNKFSDESIWYIETVNNKFFLMKESQVICEINQHVKQGLFVTENIIEFFFYDFPGFGSFDFINGLYFPIYSSALYFIDTNEIIESYYKEDKDSFLFNDKILRDSILVIF